LICSLEPATEQDQNGERNLKLKAIQARFASEALKIDKAIGSWLLQEWKRQFSVGSKERNMEYTSIKDYLEFRIVDAGAE